MIKGMRVWQSLLMFSWASWVNQEHLKVIDYLPDENRTLRKLIKKQRIRLSLEDRRRLGVKGSAIGRKTLEEVATIARADTILGWFRELVAEKWTFPHKRRGRPRTRRNVRELIVNMARENLTWVTLDSREHSGIWDLRSRGEPWPTSSRGTGSKGRLNVDPEHRGRPSSKPIGKCWLPRIS